MSDSIEKLFELNTVGLCEKSYNEDFILELQIADRLLSEVKKLYSGIFKKCEGHNKELLTGQDFLDLFQVYELMKEMQYEGMRLSKYKTITDINDEDLFDHIYKILYKDDTDECGEEEDCIAISSHFASIELGTSEILYYLNKLISNKYFDKKTTINFFWGNSETDDIRESFIDVYTSVV